MVCPRMKWRSVRPPMLMPPQTTNDQPPNGLPCRSPCICVHDVSTPSHACRLSFPSKLNLQLHWSRVQSLWSWAKFTWWTRCAAVKTGHVAGQLAFKPLSCKRFWTVCIETRTSLSRWKSLRRILAMREGCLPTRVWRWRSSLGVVAVWRPPGVLSMLSVPSLHVSGTTLELTLMTFPIWRYVQPSSLIWTALATSTSDKCIRTHEQRQIRPKRQWNKTFGHHSDSNQFYWQLWFIPKT